MELDFFKLSNQEWIEANNLTPYDVALIIDKEQKLIYFWHGVRASMKKKVEAKSIIGKNKQRFPKYKYIIGNDKIPGEILSVVGNKVVEEKRFKEIRLEDIQKSRITAKVLGLIGTIILLSNFINILSELSRPYVYLDGILHYQIELAKYDLFIQSLVVLNLTSFLFLMSSAIIFFMNKDKWNLLALSIAAIVVILVPLIFWNNYLQLYHSLISDGFIFIRGDTYRLFIAYSSVLCAFPAIISITGSLYGSAFNIKIE